MLPPLEPGVDPLAWARLVVSIAAGRIREDRDATITADLLALTHEQLATVTVVALAALDPDHRVSELIAWADDVRFGDPSSPTLDREALAQDRRHETARLVSAGVCQTCIATDLQVTTRSVSRLLAAYRDDHDGVHPISYVRNELDCTRGDRCVSSAHRRPTAAAA